jgi:hypothetical protein
MAFMRGNLGGGNDVNGQPAPGKQAPAKVEIYRNGLSFTLNVWRHVAWKSPRKQILDMVLGKKCSLLTIIEKFRLHFP